jgi:hypothetical protein
LNATSLQSLSDFSVVYLPENRRNFAQVLNQADVHIG